MICQFDILEREDNHIFLVAEKDGMLVGSVMGVICKELYGDCKPFLVVENMIVDKHVRKNGIGGQLLFELESIAKKRHCSQMILVTEADRQDACNFYEKHGFQTHNRGYKKKL